MQAIANKYTDQSLGPVALGNIVGVDGDAAQVTWQIDGQEDEGMAIVRAIDDLILRTPHINFLREARFPNARFPRQERKMAYSISRRGHDGARFLQGQRRERLRVSPPRNRR